MRDSLNTYIHEYWPAICEKAGVRKEALDALPAGPVKLLGRSHKVDLSEKHNVLTSIIYMMHSRTAGRKTNMCPYAVDACIALCNSEYSGRMSFAEVANSKLWKTALFLGDESTFTEQLSKELLRFELKALKKEMRPAFRFDGGSDTGWMMLNSWRYPSIQLYDYTKDSERYARWFNARSEAPDRYPNYHLILSFDGSWGPSLPQLLKHGATLAVVFDVKRGVALPDRWRPGKSGRYYPVFDGDVTDYRPADPPGHIIGLRFKRNKNREAAYKFGLASGFVQEVR